MRLFLIFTVVVCVVYISTYFITLDLGTATNAGGMAALVYLVILIINTTRSPFPKKIRLLVFIVALVSVSGIATAWITQYYMSHWQRNLLLTIRNVIVHGNMQNALRERTIKTLEAYYDPKRSASETLADVFRRLNPPVGDDPSTLDTLFNDPINKSGIMQRIYIESVTDSVLVLVGEDLTAIRQDSIFKKLNINVTKPRAKLVLTPKGTVYELEE